MYFLCCFIITEERNRRSTVKIMFLETNPTIQNNNNAQFNMSSKHSSEVDNRESLTRENTMSNHTVSWHYTLSNGVTLLTESSPGGKVHSQDKSNLTLVHVPGEAGQDTTQRCSIKKVHGADEEPAEQLVMECGGCLHRALSTQTTCCV